MKLKLSVLALTALASAAVALPAHARKDVANFPISAVTSHPEYAARVGDFRFVFGDAPIRGATVGQTNTRKTTNGFGRSDQDACVWAMLSALIAIKNDAIARGGTSVQGIKSVTDGAGLSSATEFQCVSGTTNSRVYLQGTIVR
jgi:hypothetical protein